MRLEETPDPKPAKDEVILNIRSAGLNHLDIRMRKSRPGLGVTIPHIPGSDASGVVHRVDANVKNIKVCEGVILSPGLSCYSCEFCNRGEHSQCLSFGIVGMSRQGTFAEHVALPAPNVFPKAKII